MRQRVQRLLDAGVMQIVAVTDPLQVGFRRQAMIGIRIEGDTGRVADALSAMLEVDYVVTTAGSFDLLAEVVCEDDDQLLDLISTSHPDASGRQLHRDVRLSQTQQTELRLGYQMTTEPTPVYEPSSDLHTPTGALYSEAARDHLWMHFTRHSTFEDPGDGGAGHTVPVITRGEGAYIWDDRGKKLPRRARRAVRRPGRPRPRGAGRGRCPAGRASWRSSRCGPTPTPGRSSWPSGSRRTLPATSTASSSPPAAARPSRAPGSWPSSTSSWSASPPSTR